LESIRIVGNNSNVTNLMAPTFIPQCADYDVGSSYKKPF